MIVNARKRECVLAQIPSRPEHGVNVSVDNCEDEVAPRRLHAFAVDVSYPRTTSVSRYASAIFQMIFKCFFKFLGPVH